MATPAWSYLSKMRIRLSYNPAQLRLNRYLALCYSSRAAGGGEASHGLLVEYYVLTFLHIFDNSGFFVAKWKSSHGTE
jgi:hypothetical protein